MIKGLGIDIVSVRKVEDLVKKYKSEQLKKIFSNKELEQEEALPGMFAAKEALSKALGTGMGEQIWFNQIEIKSGENEKPFFSESKVLKSLLSEINAKLAHLSISQEENYAVAVVMIE